MQWGGGDEVFIQTPTGSGKTTFILEVLAKCAVEKSKEVLLLVNRRLLKAQICQELAREHGVLSMSDEEVEKIHEFGGVTVYTYQEIQEELKRKPYPMGTLFAQRFRYVVFDESHYFLEDSMFNRGIPYILEVLPKIKNATKIFLSATGEEVFPFLMRIMHTDMTLLRNLVSWNADEIIVEFHERFFTGGRIFQYQQQPVFNVHDVRYFRNVDEIVEKINEDKSEEKWMVFVNNKIEAAKIKENFRKNFLYVDADEKENNSVKQQIVKNSRFEQKVLITTKVLDNGINLKDKSLKNIVLLATEKTEFIQMLGRKRFEKGEGGVHLFLMARGTQYFNFILARKIRPMVNFIGEIQKDSRFRQERMDDADFYESCQKMAIIENGRITVSKAAIEKIRLTQNFCKEMLEKLRENPHALVLEQLSWIGKEKDFQEDFYLESYGRKKNWQKIFDFMDETRGKKMDKSEQEAFRNKFAELAREYGIKLTDRNSRLAGKAKINQFCEMEGIPFCIEAVNNSRFWLVKGVAGNETQNICD